VHAPDPSRPHVRVLFDRAGERLDVPYELKLWDMTREDGRPASIVAPIDPADYRIDPLMLM